jgi:hypothetical protein
MVDNIVKDFTTPLTFSSLKLEKYHPHHPQTWLKPLF